MEKTRTTLYFTKGFHSVLKKIADREGVAMGQLIEDKLGSFVKLHENGNPQQIMPQYASGKAYVAPDTKWNRCKFKMFIHGDEACQRDFPVLRKVGVGFWRCRNCKEVKK
jgi:hypothetical protein